MEPVNANSSITFGLLTVVGGFVFGSLKYIFNIKNKVDGHTIQIEDLRKALEGNSDNHLLVMGNISEIKQQNARIETKLELLLDNRIKH